MKCMAADFPEVVKIQSIGTTWQNRSIDMLVIDGKDFVDNLKKSGWTPPQVAAQTQETFGSNYFDYVQTKISGKDDEDGQVSMADLLEELHSAKQPPSQD